VTGVQRSNPQMKSLGRRRPTKEPGREKGPSPVERAYVGSQQEGKSLEEERERGGGESEPGERERPSLWKLEVKEAESPDGYHAGSRREGTEVSDVVCEIPRALPLQPPTAATVSAAQPQCLAETASEKCHCLRGLHQRGGLSRLEK